jgi:hypothetical protein
VVSSWAFYINPDWAFMFFLNVEETGGEYILPIIVGFYALTFGLGYLLGQKLDSKKKVGVLVAVGVIFLIVVLSTYERIFFDGKYKDFASREISLEDILNFFKTYLGKNLLVGGAIFLATTIFCVMYKNK